MFAKSSLKVSHYKAKIKFEDSESSTEAFLEVANRIGYPPRTKLIMLATGAYRTGLELNSKITLKEAKKIKKHLGDIKGVSVEIITVIKPKGY